MLAPDKKIVEELLLNFLSSYQSITLAAVSLQQSQFFPLTPTPDWMKTLQTQLTQAQNLANDWLITKGPVVIAQTPQYFINYSNSVQVVASNIQNATTKAQALQYLQWLKNHITTIPASEEALQQTISSFGNDFKPYQTSIDAALTSATNDIKVDQADAKKLSDQISQLYQDIAAETAKATGSMTSIPITGTSLGFGIVAITFAITTGASPIFPIVGVVLAIGGITIAAITEAINEAKIEDNLKALEPLQVSLLQDNQAIAILQMLSPMLQNVDKALAGIHDSLDMSSIWTDASNALDDAISELQNYTDQNFKTMPQLSSLPQAASTWSDIAQMASNIQKSASGMSSVAVFNYKN